jgi:hypothetical protein
MIDSADPERPGRVFGILTQREDRRAFAFVMDDPLLYGAKAKLSAFGG